MLRQAGWRQGRWGLGVMAVEKRRKKGCKAPVRPPCARRKRC